MPLTHSLKKDLCLIVGAIICTLNPTNLNAQEVELPPDYVALVQSFTAQNIARAVVLADSNLVTLGVMDFDPNEFVDFGNIDVGNEETLKQRSQLATYSFPWALPSKKISDKISWHSLLRASFVAADQDLSLSDSGRTSTLEEETYMLFGESSWRYQLNHQWKFHAGLGGQLAYYTNSFHYADSPLRDIRATLDDTLLNTDFGAWLLDPSIGASFRGEAWGQTWEYKTMP
ncbi:Solitary outer membrane autotransporter beta-barrel domain [Gilvimarinus sp. SDUM040013]|uniref:Solitary outer membrane autotransporter beta-barrel domain n=1 Tax=Gilvimarinus gilvus TaxID=3058038 RepID=A0ABU4S220_9GAMM|nr:Solitary outer membrane autotransporter beta-barrel domain [Gilvimarinus sp. SDUM040013]MDO3385461.1 Solitary outer membrane autotransporter beta-barrel domain [Gilvimarinus sp. SDUM040013]MDX6851122.1 Solitary outer membrane autotransporter beta-barrel domain [Gilvimarinus sp. SDUM040013]